MFVYAFYIIAIIATVVLIKSAIIVVPQQSAAVIERFGRYAHTFHAGLHFIVPFIDRVAYEFTLKEVPYDVDPQVCITQDNSQVKIDGVLFYQVTDPKLAAYGTSDFEVAIENLAKTTLRSEAGKRALDTLLQERSEINMAVTGAIDEAAPNWGVKVLRYEVKDIEPPKTVLDAMEKQITAERNKRALIAQSEGEKQQAINVAQGQRAAAIAASEGEKEAAINSAEGESRAIEMVAEANAKAIRTIAEALSKDGGDRAAALKVAEQYVEAFAKIAKEGTTVVIPNNMSDLAGMIQGAMAVLPKSGDSLFKGR